jgi:hypothetical protein
MCHLKACLIRLAYTCPSRDSFQVMGPLHQAEVSTVDIDNDLRMMSYDQNTEWRKFHRVISATDVRVHIFS